MTTQGHSDMGTGVCWNTETGPLLSEADIYLDILAYDQLLGETFTIAAIGLFCFALIYFLPPLFFFRFSYL